MGVRDFAVLPLYYPISTTATNPAGVATDLQPYVGSPLEVMATLAVATAGGTQGTFNLKIQDSTDGTTYNDITGAAFTQVTTATGTQTIFFRTVNRYVQAVASLGGTSPNYGFAANLVVLDRLI